MVQKYCVVVPENRSCLGGVTGTSWAELKLKTEIDIVKASERAE